MNRPKLISFDLQGTLTDSAFSDEFWLELLPSLHAEKYRISFNEAKKQLENEFRCVGQYDELFYNHRLRLNELLPDWNFLDIIKRLKNKPALDNEVLSIVKNIPKNCPIIILSATTRDFIDIELGKASHYFKEVFSTIDDFKEAGKPHHLYLYIAELMGVKPEECFHIGDSLEMDVSNARKAGWLSFYFDKKQNKKEILTCLNQTLNQFFCTE